MFKQAVHKKRYSKELGTRKASGKEVKGNYLWFTCYNFMNIIIIMRHHNNNKKNE